MIIIKKLLILGALSLSACALGANTQKADAATVKRTVNNKQGVSVFTNYENAGYTNRLLKMGDQVDVYDTKTDLAGNKWIKIGEGQWIMEQYTVPSDSTSQSSTYGQSSPSSTYEQTSSTSQSGSTGSTSQISTYGQTSSTSQSASTGSTSQISTYGQTSSTKPQSSSTYGQSSQISTYGQTSSTSQSASTGSTSQSSTVVSQRQESSAQAQRPSARTEISSAESAAKEWIAQRESGGSYTAQNGQYYGRYQIARSYLNGDYSSANQEKVATNYVKTRYGSWSNAKSFWETHGWY